MAGDRSGRGQGKGTGGLAEIMSSLQTPSMLGLPRHAGKNTVSLLLLSRKLDYFYILEKGENLYNRFIS